MYFCSIKTGKKIKIYRFGFYFPIFRYSIAKKIKIVLIILVFCKVINIISSLNLRFYKIAATCQIPHIYLITNAFLR